MANFPRTDSLNWLQSRQNQMIVKFSTYSHSFQMQDVAKKPDILSKAALL